MKKEIHRMELRYEVLRKKQEDYIKDMEQCVFKRETIQLKYLPKVEKKNAEDKSSQGKLSRQIANLKQTLKHTTENTMQLDTTIESRRNEIQKISGFIYILINLLKILRNEVDVSITALPPPPKKNPTCM